MWRVEKLIAVDDKGNTVEVDEDRVIVTVNVDNGLKISRSLPLDETPPCLSVAVNDLLNFIAD